MLKLLLGSTICQGIDSFVDTTPHVIKRRYSFSYSNDQQVIMRIKECQVVHLQPKSHCQPCTIAMTSLKRKLKIQAEVAAIPAKIKSPYSALSKPRLETTLLARNNEIKVLEHIILDLEGSLKKHSVPVESGVANAINSIMDQTEEMTEFMKTFWQEQVHKQVLF